MNFLHPISQVSLWFTWNLLKILQHLFNRYFFFFWAFQLSAILKFWLIIVLSFYNSMLLLYLCNIQIRYLHPIIMLCHILLYLLISSLSTLRFGPRWAKVPWTFSASQPPLNPSRPCQVSHSHDASLSGVWTINIPSQRYFRCPNKVPVSPGLRNTPENGTLCASEICHLTAPAHKYPPVLQNC